MPINIPNSLPAVEILQNENIFVMTESRAEHQDIRPLRVLILNLMPTKIVTETQLLRKLSNTPIQIQVELLKTASYVSHHTDPTHLDTFYTTFDQVRNRKYDGMIITGAPLDYIRFEDVDYWEEACEIMEWCKTNVYSTMHMCWAAFAGLYYYFGIPKVDLEEKLSGVFSHRIVKEHVPLFRGLDDLFYAPQSRATDVREEEIRKVDELEVIAVSDQAGVTIVKTKDDRHFFMTCHPEYDADTLAKEYYRDQEKGLNPKLPYHYFPDDDPNRTPVVRWRSTGQIIFSNWINHYVYQNTPFEWR